MLVFWVDIGVNVCAAFLVCKSANDFLPTKATKPGENKGVSSPPLAENACLVGLNIEIRIQENSFCVHFHTYRHRHHNNALGSVRQFVRFFPHGSAVEDFQVKIVGG